MLIFEDDQSICLWPEELIASLTPAYPNRLRVVTHDGLVGYRPEDHFPAGPWKSVQGALVHPNYLSQGKEHREDPAGFPYPAAGEARAKAWKAPSYWACEKLAGGLIWRGDQERTAPCLQIPDDWLQVDQRLYLNPLRVRRLLQEARGILKVGLDDGRKIKVAASHRAQLLAHLNLTDARHLQPHEEALFRPFLREYPFELARAPGAVLQQLFSSPGELIAQILWQALHYRQTGIQAGYSDTQRGFFCNPVSAALTRAGLWDDSCEALYANILATMVGDDRLFTYRELGFQDLYTKRRKIGWARPEIVLYIEKESLARTGKEIAKSLGISWMLSDSHAPLGAIESCCAALKRHYQGPVTLIVYGDLKPSRREVIAQHFERYQTPCPGPPRLLVTRELFTPEELELISHRGGIHAEWLQPADRVLEALQNLLETLPPGNPQVDGGSPKANHPARHDIPESGVTKRLPFN